MYIRLLKTLQVNELQYTNEHSRLNMIIEVNLFNKIKCIVGVDRFSVTEK